MLNQTDMVQNPPWGFLPMFRRKQEQVNILNLPYILAVVFLPHLPAHVLNLPCIPTHVLDLPHVLAHILPPPYVSRHVRDPHCILAHAHPLPHVLAHVLGIPLSPKGGDSIIPSPKRMIIIVKNTIILWVPHSLIDGLRGLQNQHSMGVSTWGRPDPTFSAFQRGGSQPVHGLCPRALTTTFGPTCGHNNDWGSEFCASHGGELNRSSHGGALTGPNATFSLWLDVYPQVIVIHDKLKTLVSSWATPHGVDIGTTTVEEPSGPSECFTGQKDLEYVDQGARLCIKGGAERACYGEFFLHYGTFPPLSGAAPLKAERLRHLDCVEFSTEWFLAHLAGLQDHVDLPLRRMEMLICAHKYHSLGAGFAMPMWPTEGPVDAVIHYDMGSMLTPNPVADESFGFVKSSSVWHIKLDLGLDHPQYPKSE
ncbi:hypothetical protein BS47DRAFT_1360027 [Hydnum rufescens UP504]|uniref:Uncharacterized protein n=1 Tax=Hydnum rufescens UP504 TaxID=1448309 RepID=A0A9P6B3N9_9AGAM|nr:hypothetical protein BS47DRAFT_1360027 [Hydnum rufescens UP504]